MEAEGVQDGRNQQEDHLLKISMAMIYGDESEE